MPWILPNSFLCLSDLEAINLHCNITVAMYKYAVEIMNRIGICSGRKIGWLMAVLLLGVYALTAPQNHSEAEDVYQFAKVVEQGNFADQAGVNRVLALPLFSIAYKGAQLIGYSGRAFPFMIFLNRLLAVASLLLFYRILGGMTSAPPALPKGSQSSPKASGLQPTASVPILGTLLLAFSYGFWRYANEAETYVLASIFVLGAWCLVAKGNWRLAIGCSAIGVLVHLLNLIPLLLIIPLYYLFSREWKRALAHGAATALLVGIGYAVCFRFLDWGELGAQHHSAEAGLGFANLLRSGVAFGQCLISGNFLFGFEEFRELLTQFFPSRMLGEEFFMAEHMPAWIPWAGCVSVLAVMGVGFAGGGLFVARRNVDDASCFVTKEREPKAPGLRPNVFLLSCVVWLLLYLVAVLRTESGSPELWIMALIPFWLVAGRWIKGRWAWGWVVLLFAHNLIAGLLPVMSEKTDYHAAKGKWLVENSTADDLVLTSYEPIMIFYLDYFTSAKIASSGSVTLEEIQHRLESCEGEVYALSNFFQPLVSMEERNPALYEKMWATGQALRSGFVKTVDDEFGGIYKLSEE